MPARKTLRIKKYMRTSPFLLSFFLSLFLLVFPLVCCDRRFVCRCCLVSSLVPPPISPFVCLCDGVLLDRRFVCLLCLVFSPTKSDFARTSTFDCRYQPQQYVGSWVRIDIPTALSHSHLCASPLTAASLK